MKVILMPTGSNRLYREVCQKSGVTRVFDMGNAVRLYFSNSESDFIDMKDMKIREVTDNVDKGR